MSQKAPEDTPLIDLGFNARVTNVLQNNNRWSLSQLIEMTPREVLAMRNTIGAQQRIGRKSYDHIIEVLANAGHHLKQLPSRTR